MKSLFTALVLLFSSVLFAEEPHGSPQSGGNYQRMKNIQLGKVRDRELKDYERLFKAIWPSLPQDFLGDFYSLDSDKILSHYIKFKLESNPDTPFRWLDVGAGFGLPQRVATNPALIVEMETH